MSIKKAITRACLVFLVLPLSGCLFNVGSKYGYQYPIQSNGTVDMSLAPDDDIRELTLNGYLLTGGEPLSPRLFCFGNKYFFPSGVFPATYVGVSAGIPAANGFFYTAKFKLWGFTLRSPRCLAEPDGNGNATIKLAVNVGSHFVPILSQKNMSCIAEKLQGERKDNLTATKECLAVDPRGTNNPLGLNDNVQEINVLRLKVSYAYYNIYMVPSF